mgnify:CR=1 FL=1
MQPPRQKQCPTLQALLLPRNPSTAVPAVPLPLTREAFGHDQRPRAPSRWARRLPPADTRPQAGQARGTTPQVLNHPNGVQGCPLVFFPPIS